MTSKSDYVTSWLTHLRGAVDQETLILGPKTQFLTSTLSERKGLEILEKVEKS